MKAKSPKPLGFLSRAQNPSGTANQSIISAPNIADVYKLSVFENGCASTALPWQQCSLPNLAQPFAHRFSGALPSAFPPSDAHERPVFPAFLHFSHIGFARLLHSSTPSKPAPSGSSALPFRQNVEFTA